jgi:arginyl-tRNA synthetase
MRILDLIKERFASALRPLVSNSEVHASRLARARDPRFGDYQANLAMGLAKELGRDPSSLAHDIVRQLQIDDLCESVEVAGKGFINLTLRKSWIEHQTSQLAGDARLGVAVVDAPKTYIIDYSSPNVAKPMHVGHIRSTVIGDSIKRILHFVGHRTIADNHLGDWGTQFGMVIYGYKHFADRAAFARLPVAELGRLYRRVQQIIGYQQALGQRAELQSKATQAEMRWNQSRAAAAQDPKQEKQAKSAEKTWEAAQHELRSCLEKIDAFRQDASLLSDANEHPDLEQRVQAETARLHAGDLENRKLWETFLPFCLEEIHQVYRRLDIHFDYELGESYYNDMLPGVVRDLIDRKLASDSDGAICVFLEGYDAPMIIRKKDGAFLYATTDLATVRYRMEHFSPDAILYVVDHRQSEHFEKLFATLRTIGIRDVELKHISFGTVLGSDGKPFKTRSGSVVGLESLLDEAVQRALDVVRSPERRMTEELGEAELQDVATAVGLGAIKYADLVHNRTSDYVFDLDRMVQMEGNTSAYIQYSYARIQSILRKGNTSPSKWSDIVVRLDTVIERDLALHLLRFEEVLHQSLEDYQPSVLTAYLYETAKLFASFFEQCPVLQAADPDLVLSRQMLIHVTGEVLARGLGLLGIRVVQKM